MLEALQQVFGFHWADTLPIGAARACFLLFFGTIVLFAFAFPRRFVYEGAPDAARWRDLRLWVVIVMAIPTVIYLAF